MPSAIRFEHENGERRDFSYGELDRDADRLAAALRRRGVRRGDRVALVLPQRFETAVAHIAIYRLGAIAVPLSFLFGPEALEYRINDSGATLAIVDENGIDNVLAARSLCPQLATIVAVGAAEGRGDVDWTAALAAESGRFKAERTSRRRSRRAHLHQRHHGAAEGRAAAAPGPDRQPVRVRRQPELVRLFWSGPFP
jgi:acetyl-CoA synthetase